MNEKPQCSDCEQQMEKGFIPDYSYRNSDYSILGTVWYAGDSESKSLLWHKNQICQSRRLQNTKSHLVPMPSMWSASILCRVNSYCYSFSNVSLNSQVGQAVPNDD
jgi:hypothetical protein